ncbi:hypothetical protein [Streptomyces cremeus]|uniref:MarR family transcriptional regulator n=1 Tax=Streptomyces cremeus TaxID=66881 RepID=A0ABV5P998_STRCM
MAVQELSRTLHAPAHPMAKPGYGKKAAPDQLPLDGGTFAHLPRREASIARYIDGLPEGADISIKTLAREMEAYGQMAIGSALKYLTAAGHLRRFREEVWVEREGYRQVTRTWFSRTARHEHWWRALVLGDVPESGKEHDVPVDEPGEAERRGYDALARVARSEPQLPLSAASCGALAPLAAEWFKRGMSEAQFVRTLTFCLPQPVRHPFGFVQRRLIDEMPPELPGPVQGLIAMECTGCGVPGPAEALPGGLCGPCRSTPYARPEKGLPADVVRGKAERIRREIQQTQGMRGYGRGPRPPRR